MKRILFLILSTIILASFVFWKNSSFTALTEVKSHLQRNYFPVYTIIKNTILENDTDFPNMGDNINVPTFKLILSKRDVNHLLNLHKQLENSDSGLDYYSRNNVWRKAKLEFNGKKYKIKVKSHGRAPSNHRNGYHISYAIRLTNNEQINGVKRFSLIVRDHIQSGKFLTYSLAEEYDLITKKESLVNLEVNNWPSKYYYFDSRMDNAFMERFGRSSYKRFGYDLGETESTAKSLLIDRLPYTSSQMKEIFYKEMSQEDSYNELFRTNYFNFFDSVNNVLASENSNVIDKYFNYDYITSFMAVNSLLGHGSHFSTRENFYIFYNVSDGFLYPVFTRDTNTHKLRYRENTTIESQLTEKNNLLFSLLNRNHKLRVKKYKKIYDYIQNYGSDVRFEHEKLIDFFNDLSYFGRFKNLLDKYGIYDENFIDENVEAWEKYLNLSEFTAGYRYLDDKLLIQVEPNSPSGLTLNGLTDLTGVKKINLYKRGNNQDELMFFGDVNDWNISDIALMPDLDKNMQIKPVIYLYEIYQDDSAVIDELSFKIFFTNPVTGNTLSNKIEETKISPIKNPYKLDSNLLEAEKVLNDNNISYTASSNNVHIHEGTYKLHSNLVLPRGISLTIDPGVILLIASDKNIISGAGLNFIGSKEKNILISAIDENKPFGVIGSNNGKSKITNLYLTGGSESWIENVYYSGALSIYNNSSVEIYNSNISFNRADDGLNIKYSPEVKIVDSNFENNFADQIDLDYSNGIVKNSIFAYNAESVADTNGDGLDISGSVVEVAENTFFNLSDKGISAGEESKVLVLNNTFNSNNSAITVKDLTDVYLLNNEFNNNTLNIDLYQKKPTFGGGRVYSSKVIPNIRIGKKSEFKQLENEILKDLYNEFF